MTYPPLFRPYMQTHQLCRHDLDVWKDIDKTQNHSEENHLPGIGSEDSQVLMAEYFGWSTNKLICIPL